MEVTQQYLKECFRYNKGTGVLTWRTRPREHFATLNAQRTWNSKFAGCRAGMTPPPGYRVIRLGGKNHYAHRLIFKLIYGYIPNGIDHKDQNKDNNSIQNLREASVAENMQNRGIQQNNISGVRGVSWRKSKSRWRAQIQVNGEAIELGLFKHLEEAKQTVQNARDKYHGEFAYSTNATN